MCCVPRTTELPDRKISCRRHRVNYVLCPWNLPTVLLVKYRLPSTSGQWMVFQGRLLYYSSEYARTAEINKETKKLIQSSILRMSLKLKTISFLRTFVSF